MADKRVAALDELRKRAARFRQTLADDLAGFGGILRCGRCGHERGLGDVAGSLRRGWPSCCGFTMTWVTQRQLDQESHAASQQDTKE